MDNANSFYSVWHSVDEIPEEKRLCIAVFHAGIFGFLPFVAEVVNYELRGPIWDIRIKGYDKYDGLTDFTKTIVWAYIDDILPKKYTNHEKGKSIN